MRCPFCGSHLDNDAKYCNDCGTAVDSECKGKNVNYRSYTVGRPEQTVRPAEPAYKYRQAEKLSNPEPKPQPNKPTPPVFNNSFPNQNFPFNPKNRTVKKKNGCGIAILIVIIIFAVSSIIGAIFGEEADDIFDANDNFSYYEQNEEQGDNEGFVTDEMCGRFDGEYYLNDYVNIAFKVPDGFDNISDSFSNTDLDLAFEKDDEQILTGYEYDESAEDFLERYSELVSEELESYNDGAESTITDTVKKQVGENTFYGKTVYCGELDGECDVSDIYATAVDGFVFFIEIDSLSPEFNKSIINSFVEAHTE